jgi:hypothetical protein
VNLPVDPGDGFEEGSYVELINPLLNTYEMRDDNGRRAIPDRRDDRI